MKSQLRKPVKVIHLCSGMTFARRFVLPLAQRQKSNGTYDVEIWVEGGGKSGSIPTSACASPIVRCQELSWNFPNALLKIRDLFLLWLRLKEKDPQIVHVHTTRASLFPLLIARLARIPVRIYHNHGFPYLGHRGLVRFFLKLIERINSRLATHCLTVSKSNLCEIETDGTVAKGRFKVLANGSIAGIDFEEFAPSLFDREHQLKFRKQWGLPDDSFVIGYVGRPHRRKGFHFQLRAWEESGLWQDERNFLFVVGCSLADCHKVVSAHARNIIAVEKLEDMPSFFSACDVISLPSYHEGFPYALLEGSASAKPLVGFDIPGIRCIIQHDSTGFLVPVGDLPRVLEVYRLLRENPTLSLDLGRKARQWAFSFFERSAVLDAMDVFYRDLIVYLQALPQRDFQPVKIGPAAPSARRAKNKQI